MTKDKKGIFLEVKMAVVAPFCKYKKTNFKIYIVMLLAFAVYFAYDGYYNQKFILKHTNIGKPDSTLVFNRKSPPVLAAGAVVLAIVYWKKKDKKLIADDEAIVFSKKDRIPYNSIEGIKDNYKSKGFFVIEYKSPDGRKSQRKISDRDYDNLGAVLELLVSKITG
jgi:hypothetical protein